MRLRRLTISLGVAALVAVALPAAGGSAQTDPVAESLDQRLIALAEAFETGGASAGLGRAASLGLMTRDDLVEVHVISAAVSQARAAVAASGGVVLADHGDGFLDALVPMSGLVDVASSAGVAALIPAHVPVPEEGSVLSEGVPYTDADDYHSAAGGFTGIIAKVAVIDTGFAGLGTAQASGDISADVKTESFCAAGLDGSTTHGTGVSEIVSDMAPGAELHLICFDSSLDYGAIGSGGIVDYLVDNEIDVVNHSIGYFNIDSGRGDVGSFEPWETARANGVLWVNSSGNYAERHWGGGGPIRRRHRDGRNP